MRVEDLLVMLQQLYDTLKFLYEQETTLEITFVIKPSCYDILSEQHKTTDV